MRPRCNTARCSSASRVWAERVALGRYLLLVTLSAGQVGYSPADEVEVLNEDFDSARPGDFAAALLAHDNVELVPGSGVEGSNAIRVWYRGNARGSERVIINHPLPPAEAYSLSFSVRFCPGFDFAKGGKLHGLGPARPVAGGKRVEPARWSARVMFRQDGGLQSYLYSQNKQGQYGEVETARDFRFQTDRYYRITMQVRLNDPRRSDGSMLILVDGDPKVTHSKVQFRSSDDERSRISTLMFNTFHGGHGPEWAPRDAMGDYTVVCAFFDDFVVAPLAY